MAQFKIYRSTDGSAPVLTGQVGSLVALLDACLVNGYGSKAAAGWTKSFSGTNKAVYRAPVGVRHYLRIQDDGPVAANEVRMHGYETMSDVDTGTGIFPTSGQSSFGLICRKSDTTDSTAQAWVIAGDDRTFYLFSNSMGYMFGEIYSLGTEDAHRTMLVGRGSENQNLAASGIYNLGSLAGNLLVSSGGTSIAAYMPRSYTGLGASEPIRMHGDDVKSGSNTYAGNNLVFPSPVDGGLYISPVWVHENNVIRGRLRGLFQPLHPPSSFAVGDTFSGVGDFAGKTFEFIAGSKHVNAGIYVLETSDTLETNS